MVWHIDAFFAKDKKKRKEKKPTAAGQCSRSTGTELQLLLSAWWGSVVPVTPEEPANKCRLASPKTSSGSSTLTYVQV